MKKLILISSIVFSFMSCKKQEVENPAQQPLYTNGYVTFKSGKITLKVVSNFDYPYIQIKKDKSTIKMINENTVNRIKTNFDYSFNVSKGTYNIYMHASGSGITHNLKVFFNDTIEVPVLFVDNVQSSTYFNIK